MVDMNKPDLKITFGLNNKKEYFESDIVLHLLEEIARLEKANKGFDQICEERFNEIKQLKKKLKYFEEAMGGTFEEVFNKDIVSKVNENG